jgi:hypothetical protein
MPRSVYLGQRALHCLLDAELATLLDHVRMAFAGIGNQPFVPSPLAVDDANTEVLLDRLDGSPKVGSSLFRALPGGGGGEPGEAMGQPALEVKAPTEREAFRIQLSGSIELLLVEREIS